jgi:hypothetical protein
VEVKGRSILCSPRASGIGGPVVDSLCRTGVTPRLFRDKLNLLVEWGRMYEMKPVDPSI